MTASPSRSARSPSTLRLYFYVLLASLLLALPPVVWPELDLTVARYFLRPDAPIHTAQWLWVDGINEYTPDLFRALAYGGLLGWLLAAVASKLWSRHADALRRSCLPFAFIGLGVALGPGLATWATKEVHSRARPLDVVQFGGTRSFTPALMQARQCSDNCAFSSGHAACGFFIASLMLLQPRRRGRWLAIGVVAGLLVSFARVSVGAHWLSDVLWAFPITWIVSGLVWRLLTLIHPPQPPSPSP